MVTLTWLRGLLARRRGRMLGTAVGVAVGVALLASIGSFLSAANQRMTRLAIGRVPVDWQLEDQPGAAQRPVLDTVARFRGVRAALPVGFAKTGGLQAGQGTVQRTGPGRVLGLPARVRIEPGKVCA